MHLKPPKVPCGTCPYRKDVPSGIWDRSEYEKLPEYDKSTSEQPPQVFLCHQKDGNLCGGWLLCHDRDHLLSLRVGPIMYGVELDESVWTYSSDVPIFGSGAEAAEHGMVEIEKPSVEAQRKIAGLERKRDNE